MTTSVRLAAFAAALVAVFALAFALGRSVGPWEGAEPTHDSTQQQEEVHDDGH